MSIRAVNFWTGDGGLFDPWLQRIVDQGFQGVRCGPVNDMSPTLYGDLVGQITAAGLVPLVITKRADQMALVGGEDFLVCGQNEIDIPGQDGPLDVGAAIEISQEAGRRGLRNFAPSTSGFHYRGVMAQRRLPWDRFHPTTGGDWHRYGNDHSFTSVTPWDAPFWPPSAWRSKPTPWSHRDHEVLEMRRIIGARPFILSECGYRKSDWTDQERCDGVIYDRDLWERAGAVAVVLYQILSAVPPSGDDYGVYEADEVTVNPHGRAFTQGVSA